MGIQNNEDRYCVVQQSLNPASVAANTSAEQTFTVPGLQVGDVVHVSKPSVTAGLVISTARVSAANTLAITFGNLTGSGIDAAAETYDIFVFRPEKKFTSVQL